MRLFTTASVVIMSSIGMASAAQQVCDNREVIVASLAEKYGESVQSIALDNGGNLLEIFASDEGTWTAILTSPRGQACIVGAGEAFEQVSRTPAISS